MDKQTEGSFYMERSRQTAPLAAGFLGGLAGTFVMDLILMASFQAAGLPFTLCFSLVGDTLARAFSSMGVTVAGGILTGIIGHYLIGPLVGMLFTTLITRVPALHVDTRKRCILAAIVYTELISQPLLALMPILLKVDRLTLILWYGGSLIMHLILAVIMGSIVAQRLHLGGQGAGQIES